MFKLRKSLNILSIIKNKQNAFSDNFNKKFERLEKFVAGTFAEVWLKFWVNLAKDYRDVAIDVMKEIRDNPSKAIIIGTSSWLVATFYVNNPNAQHFRQNFLQASNDAAVVHHNLVRPDVLDYLKHIESCYNKDTLRYQSLGLFSVIWVDKGPQQCNAYEMQCDYLKYDFAEKFNNIIDVGFLDTWWYLVKKMKDYDVNF